MCLLIFFQKTTRLPALLYFGKAYLCCVSTKWVDLNGYGCVQRWVPTYFKTSQPKKNDRCALSLLLFTCLITKLSTFYIFSFFILYSFIFLGFFFSFGACLGMIEGVSNFGTPNMKNVRVLYEKGVSNVSSHSWEKK